MAEAGAPKTLHPLLEALPLISDDAFRLCVILAKVAVVDKTAMPEGLRDEFEAHLGGAVESEPLLDSCTFLVRQATAQAVTAEQISATLSSMAGFTAARVDTLTSLLNLPSDVDSSSSDTSEPPRQQQRGEAEAAAEEGAAGRGGGGEGGQLSAPPAAGAESAGGAAAGAAAPPPPASSPLLLDRPPRGLSEVPLSGDDEGALDESVDVDGGSPTSTSRVLSFRQCGRRFLPPHTLCRWPRPRFHCARCRPKR
jgi:hypothetical protein